MTYIYDPSNKFGYKDTLPEGHPEKIIKGAEFDVEFNNIANAINGIESGNGGSGGGIEEAPEDGLIYARKDASWVEITSGGGGTGGSTDWPDITNKPEPIKDLAAENVSTQSLITGGRY